MTNEQKRDAWLQAYCAALSQGLAWSIDRCVDQGNSDWKTAYQEADEIAISAADAALVALLERFPEPQEGPSQPEADAVCAAKVEMDEQREKDVLALVDAARNVIHSNEQGRYGKPSWPEAITALRAALVPFSGKAPKAKLPPPSMDEGECCTTYRISSGISIWSSLDERHQGEWCATNLHDSDHGPNMRYFPTPEAALDALVEAGLVKP